MGSKSKFAKKQHYTDIFLPKGSTFMAIGGITLMLVIYFLASHYSNGFIEAEGYSAFDGAQNNPLIRVIYFVPWASWIDRALDFAMWGVIAAAFFVIAWSISATRTTFTNHRLVEGFENFKDQKAQWRKNFMFAMILRVVLIFIIIYLVSTIIFKIIPGLSLAVFTIIYYLDFPGVVQILLNCVYMFLALSGVAMAIKMFRHINTL